MARHYIARMTGLSRAQVTRLIAGHRKSGGVKEVEYQRTKFATRYTATDVRLLAYVDQAHGNLSGPATRRTLEREYFDYGQSVYAPVSHRCPPALENAPRFPHSHSADYSFFFPKTTRKDPTAQRSPSVFPLQLILR